MHKETDTLSREMPKYKSHKIVWALKVIGVTDPSKPNEETDGSRVLTFVDGDYENIRVDRAYVQKHDPQPGGYYVLYKDGYKSFSPAEAFEEGYSKV